MNDKTFKHNLKGRSPDHPPRSDAKAIMVTTTKTGIHVKPIDVQKFIIIASRKKCKNMAPLYPVIYRYNYASLIIHILE